MKFFISFILLILTMNAMNLEPYQKRVEQLSDEKKRVLFHKGHLVANILTRNQTASTLVRFVTHHFTNQMISLIQIVVGLVLMMQLRAQ